MVRPARSSKLFCNRGHLRSEENFRVSLSQTGTVQRACKLCEKIRQAENRRWNSYQAIELLGGCCVDCGYKEHLDALQFDHVRGNKVICVTSLFSATWKAKSLQVELAKCELRCANCHAIVTRKRENNDY